MKKTKAEAIQETNAKEITPENAAEREKEEKKMAMKPFYPDDWENSFGVPVTQHKNVSLDTMDEFGSYKDIPEKLRE